MDNFIERLEQYIESIEYLRKKYFTDKNYLPDEANPNLSYEVEKKWVKIYKIDSENNIIGVFAFVEIDTGNIFERANNPKAPRKNKIKGNIFSEENGLESVKKTNPNYLI